MTMKPLTDRAQVAVELPSRSYSGSFGRASGFEVRAEPDGVAIRIAGSRAEPRAIEVHLHWYLLADVLRELAQAMDGASPGLDAPQRAALAEATDALARALGPSEPDGDPLDAPGDLGP